MGSPEKQKGMSRITEQAGGGWWCTKVHLLRWFLMPPGPSKAGRRTVLVKLCTHGKCNGSEGKQSAAQRGPWEAVIQGGSTEKGKQEVTSLPWRWNATELGTPVTKGPHSRY